MRKAPAAAGFDPQEGEAYLRSKSPDTVDAKLRPGEYVMPPDAVKRVGVGQLEQMRLAGHEPRNARQRAVSDYRTLVAAEEIRRDRKRLQAALDVGAQEQGKPHMEDGGLVDPVQAQPTPNPSTSTVAAVTPALASAAAAPSASTVTSDAFGSKPSDPSTYEPPDHEEVARSVLDSTNRQAADAMGNQMNVASQQQDSEMASIMETLRRL